NEGAAPRDRPVAFTVRFGSISASDPHVAARALPKRAAVAPVGMVGVVVVAEVGLIAVFAIHVGLVDVGFVRVGLIGVGLVIGRARQLVIIDSVAVGVGIAH